MFKSVIPVLRAAVAAAVVAALPFGASANTISGIGASALKSFNLASGSSMTVDVVNAGLHGAIVVRAVTGQTTEARAWCIVYNGPEQQPSAARVSSIAPLAAQNVTWNATTRELTINGGVVNDERIGIQLSIPVGTFVTLKKDGKLVKQGYVNTSFMVQGGETFTNLPAYDERTAIAETLDDAGTECSPTAGPDCYYQACSSALPSGAACTINWRVCYAAGGTLEAVIDDACQ